MYIRSSASRLALAAVCTFCLSAACAQEQGTAAREDTTGNVVSVSVSTLVVRSDDNLFHLFVFDNYTQKPKSIATGSRVRVVSVPGREPGVRIAQDVVIVEAPHKSDTSATTKPAPPEVIPREVRDVESEIKRDTKRFGAGFRIGTALDPELFMLGVQARMGPIFHRNLWFRPNIEIGFGEITSIVGVNLEAIYRLPSKESKWSTYFGAGPGLNFTTQNFEQTSSSGSHISWGDFNYKTGFNILMGIQHRKGPFVEVKTAVYSHPAPVLRLIGGYTF